MQVPAEFGYERATGVDDALERLARLGPGARVVAGGHSLLPMMKLRLAAPEYLVDINDLRELDFIRLDGEELRIGALTRHRQLLESDLLAARFPIFRDAERVIADPPVRNRGTIGGALCQADPAEDLSAVCVVCNARAVIKGRDGERVIGMDEFRRGPYQTAVEDGELLVEIRVPLRGRSGSAYEKVERRAGDWSIAAAGAAVWMQDGRIADCGVSLAAVGAGAARVSRAEAALRGNEPSQEALEEAGRVAAEDCSPVSDQRGTAEYKRHLAGELTKRALRRAVDRASN